LTLLSSEDMNRLGLKAYTINPINLMNILRKKISELGVNGIDIIVNPLIFNQSYFVNNLGSRYMSCSVDSRTYWDTVTIAINKCIESASTFGKTVTHTFVQDAFVIASEPINVQQSIMPTPAVIAVVKSDHAEHIRSLTLTHTRPPHEDFEMFLSQSQQLSVLFMEHFNEEITRFKTGIGQPYLLFKGFPVDAILPSTPTTVISTDKQTFVSESILMGMNQCFGQPFSYRYEKDGHCIHNICPHPMFEESLSNQGSKKTFGFHQEMAFHAIKPDYLLLFCLREDHNGSCITSMLDMQQAIDAMEPEILDILRQPLYRISVPASYQREDWDPTWQPVIQGGTIVIADHCTVTFKSEEAEHALKAFRKGLDQLASGVHLEPGDLLILDNHRILHGRSSFEPLYNGTDRWLQRSYCHKNLDGAKTMWPHSGRVFE